MIIIGADYHPGFQQIAFVDTKLGNCKSADCSTFFNNYRFETSPTPHPSLT
jgi:hypothetical protein